jgi:AraC-like DNA-binding protein
MAANTATCLRCGIRGEQDLIGSTDADYLPPEVAKAYREDDKKVIRTGKPLVDRLELFYDEQKRLDWFLTTKLPLRDRSGDVIGVIGVARRDEKRMMHHDVLEVTAAVSFARDNRHRVTTAADLAKAVGVSERQLYRHLRAALGVSPYELLLRTRIKFAAEQLAQTSLPIVEIALRHGFCDQSAFTQQFRKHIGQTPRAFRLSHFG